MKTLYILFLIITLPFFMQAQHKKKQLTKVDSLIRQAHKYRVGVMVSRDLDKSFSLFNEAAQLGSSKAIHAIGRMYQFGDACEQNIETAISYYEKAGAKGYGPSYYNIAKLNLHGEGNLPIDYEKAYTYYVKSAELKYPGGYYGTGYLLFRGLGCEQNYTKALEYFMKGAETNRNSCLYNVGICYRNGYGVEQNEEIAMEYLHKAAESGYFIAEKEVLVSTPENSFTESISLFSDGDSIQQYIEIPESQNEIQVQGQWQGQKISYDYSGQFIIRQESIKLNIKTEGNELSGVWIENDTSIIDLEGTVFNNQLLLSKGKTVRKTRIGAKYKWEMQQLNFNAQRINNQVILSGNLHEFTPSYREPGQPTYIVLRKLNEEKISAIDADETLLNELAIEMPSLKINPIQQQISTESTESINAYTPFKEIKTITPQSLAYPNPFVNEFTVQVNLPANEKVDISVYDIRGTLVQVIKKGELTKGIHQFKGGAHLNTGSYVVAIKYLNQQKSDAIIVIKQG